jgi:hypothetical protein
VIGMARISDRHAPESVIGMVQIMQEELGHLIGGQA